MDNVKDRDSKGRASGNRSVGENASCAKLTENEVREIRRLYATGEYRNGVLARMFEVGTTTIHNIVHRKKWRHVK